MPVKLLEKELLEALNSLILAETQVMKCQDFVEAVRKARVVLRGRKRPTPP
jgi:hypothetical protein